MVWIRAVFGLECNWIWLGFDLDLGWIESGFGRLCFKDHKQHAKMNQVMRTAQKEQGLVWVWIGFGLNLALTWGWICSRCCLYSGLVVVGFGLDLVCIWLGSSLNLN